MLTKYAQAASISGGCKEQVWSCQVADHLILVPATHSHVLSFRHPLPLPQPHGSFFFFYFFVCVCVRGGWGWSGREEKVEVVQEAWITDSSFPWTKYSTFPERRQWLQFRSWHCTVPEIHTIPGVAVNCWAAAAGSTLTWLAGLWPGCSRGDAPAGTLVSSREWHPQPVLPSSYGALLWFAPVLPEHLPGSTFPQQQGLMEKVLCFKTLWMAFIFRHCRRYRVKAYCSYGKRSLKRRQYLK